MLKPQIDFHRASSVPVYSMNTIFSGKPNRVNDLDLEGIVFSDMPWLVRTSGRFDRTALPFALNTPYRYSVTDRLFALGMDAYVLNRLATCMHADPRQIYAGASGLFIGRLGWTGPQDLRLGQVHRWTTPGVGATHQPRKGLTCSARSTLTDDQAVNRHWSEDPSPGATACQRLKLVCRNYWTRRGEIDPGHARR